MDAKNNGQQTVSAMLLEGQKQIEAKLDQVSTTTARLDVNVTELRARFDAHKEHTTERVKKLFDFKDEHERRIGTIEKSYTPRDLFERYIDQQREDANRRDDQNRKDKKEIEDKVDAVTVAVAKIMAVSAVILVVAQFAMKVVWR